MVSTALSSKVTVVADHALARRLEAAEAQSFRRFALAAQAQHPELNIAISEIGGGVAVRYSPSDPFNGVKGVGLDGPVDPQQWDCAERTFLDTGSPVVIDLCPLADTAFIARLVQSDYRLGSFETVLFRPILGVTNTLAPSLDPGVTIAVAEDASEWSRVLDVGFADGGEPMRFAVDIGRVRARTPGSFMLLARVDGVNAGAGGMSIYDGVAHMNGAAVLPAFRRRGLQQALTAARLAMAQQLGCTVAKMDVLAGSASHRNAARAGFQVAYTRPQFVRSSVTARSPTANRPAETPAPSR